MKFFLIFTLFYLNFNLFGSVTTNQINNFNKFWPVLTKIESNNCISAHNKRENARGIAQIRKNYLKDSNNFGKTKYNHKDCFDPKISKIIVFNYFLRYCPDALENGDFETLAKTHNGGPNWQKNSKKSLTVAKNLSIYWQKIERELNVNYR